MQHALFALPWHDMLLPKPSWAEKIIRPILVYIVLLGAFRVMSKRDLTQNTTFDLLIVLLLSNIVQNALIGDDNSIFGAIAGAITLLLMSTVLNRLSAKSVKARRLLEGEPILLVHNGQVLDENMRRYAISRPDLNAGLRAENMITLGDVRYAFLELDGTISVIRKSEQSARPIACHPRLRRTIKNRDNAQVPDVGNRGRRQLRKTAIEGEGTSPLPGVMQGIGGAEFPRPKSVRDLSVSLGDFRKKFKDWKTLH